MFKRLLEPKIIDESSFFLWGTRQTGKSTLLKTLYPQALFLDLLHNDLYTKYISQPSLLRQELLSSQAPVKTTALFSAASDHKRLIIIDEIQKIPALLDEVHGLIENHGFIFGLCGSSARKLRRGHANLLGGRAIRYELFGLVAQEIGADFDLKRMLNIGYLPRHYLSSQPDLLLHSYVNDYLKEEIIAEALVRNIPSFSRFLTIAALADTELVNYSTISRECGVSSHAVKEYFQILVDTLLGRYLEAYTKRPKRRVIAAPKFYFADVGTVNFLAKRGQLEPGSELYGKAFENWLHHELCAYREYKNHRFDLSYWRLASGIEVDFIINDVEIAIEAKATSLANRDHLKGLRALVDDHPKVKRRLLISLDPTPRRTDDGIEIFPAKHFIDELWGGGIL